MEVFIIVLLVFTGILLLVLEFLVIPGVAVAGIGGVAFMVWAIIYAYKALGTSAGNITLFSTVFAFIAILFWVLRSKTWKKAELETGIDGMAHENETEGISVGDLGETISRLAPMGKVKVSGKVVEGKSLEGYINAHEKIEVIKVRNTNIIVKPIKS